MDLFRETVKKICSGLNKNQVDYIIIGGFAVISHGYPRTTADIDIWYKPTLENFHKIIRTLEEFKVDVDDLKEMIFDPKAAYLRISSLGIRTEFLPQMQGLTYSESKQKTRKVSIDEITFDVISLNDLIKNKNQVARPKDLLDVAELEKRHKPQ